ncbi:DUF6452 family protein [Flavobacterium nackdongense]|uniref:DUF4843 domain-containing protein n=1 Tax=Flavobacterium nackdongense TaxID=2547394 RepID=A0A4P6Y6U5_9FLAO|nr:DUF6452 family protein [Flavobacterium nackdongense]QBN18209.1 hypothetical protein E1750_05110 [Flavobacterium nackdongense]
MKKIVALLLIVLFTSSSCEKDDICDANTPTTPRLVIDFYNITTPSVKKNVTDLKVIGEGMTEGIIFNEGSSGEAQYLANGSSISIPLKTDANSTTYSFILNSGNPNPTLIDTDKVTFNYTRNDVFVSRACGFKTLFTFVPNNPILHIAVPATKSKWMQFINIEKSNIDNENETHIKVFF